MLGSAGSEQPRLINHEIIFEVCIPTYVTTLPQRHRQTVEQADGRIAAPKCGASRGKKIRLFVDRYRAIELTDSVAINCISRHTRILTD